MEEFQELLTHPQLALEMEAIRAGLHDPLWRLENLYFILDETGKKIPFRLNEVQWDFLQKRHCLNLILKGRQLGFTTLIQIEMLDACLFTDNLHAGVIAHNQDDAKRFFRNKIKFAYDNIPAWVRPLIPKLIKDSESELSLSNGSNLHVGTSMRSGTLQRLHVSEYGKLCKSYPDRAREVKTGALNAVHVGQRVDVESTAEGREGDFYDMVQIAQSKKRRGEILTEMDFKFFFYPWWAEKRYALDASVQLAASDITYFDGLRDEHGIHLSQAQKSWYIKKREVMGDDMKREFPSHPDEAFEASIIGSYYAGQLARLEEQGHICDVPYQPQLPVDTYWDIGRHDYTAIWFVQAMPGGSFHVIDYHQDNSRELQAYIRVLAERGYFYRYHIGPHDLEVTEMMAPKSRKQMMADLGVDFIIAPNLPLHDGIQAARAHFPLCWFDKTRCAPEGLKALRGYKKKWSDVLGVFLDAPKHDENSHGADAFRYFSVKPMGWREGENEYVPTLEERRGTWMSN